MSQYKMISIPEAVATVLAHTPALPAEAVPLRLALGRVLAAPVTAGEALPPFPASIKDGYAVRHADGAGERDVVGESRAGTIDQAVECGPGQAVYVTTGAPVPRGADCVVQIEDTRAAAGGASAAAAAEGGEATRRAPPVKAGGKVQILVAPGKVGQDIRAVGSDIQLRRFWGSLFLVFRGFVRRPFVAAARVARALCPLSPPPPLIPFQLGQSLTFPALKKSPFPTLLESPKNLNPPKHTKNQQKKPHETGPAPRSSPRASAWAWPRWGCSRRSGPRR